MARIKGATMTHKRRKKMLKLAKGFYGCKSKHFKMAKQQVMKSGNYALAGRRMKKRQFRNLLQHFTTTSRRCRSITSVRMAKKRPRKRKCIRRSMRIISASSIF